MLTVKEAQNIICQLAKNFGTEMVSIQNAQGRVLAEDIVADRDYPPFNRAAMDGYAIRVEDFLENGLREFQITEEIYAGRLPSKSITKGTCYKIMTGSSTPLDADTIIRVEDAAQNGNKVSFLTTQIKKGQNIAKRGEDKKEGELVLRRNTLLKAPEIAALAVLGKKNILVQKIPVVSIISTGDEVIPIEQTVLPHLIRDSNSYALEGFLKNYSVNVVNKRLVSDNKEILSKTILDFIDSDIIIISGGVSTGDADYVPEVLNAARVEKIFHKVAIKPGKPLWFGKSRSGVVFALPGNPMSVQVAFKIFIEPFLRKCFGLPDLLILKMPMATDRIKKISFDEYFPCAIESKDISALRPVIINGSGDVTSTLHSHGLALQEQERKELREGDLVDFFFW
jgi:molybdopterin molybdotransferase